MRENKGGTKVPGGFYFDRKTWEIVPVNGKEGVLPRGAGEHYVKIPTLLMLAGAPLGGAAFVIFLPFVGFAILAETLLGKVLKPVKAAAAKPEPSTRG